MAATGLYLLNGLDMYTTYGFVPDKGCSNDILRPRKRKEPYSNDWPENNGREYDLLSTPKYEDKQIRLTGHIHATNETDFWTKYNALISVFNNTGVNTLKCNEFGANKDVKVFYLDTPNYNRLTRIKTGNKIFIKIELLLQEVQQA